MTPAFVGSEQQISISGGVNPPSDIASGRIIIMMIRMISPMTGLKNLVEEIMMADIMLRMITGRRTTGNNNARKLWR